MVDYKYVILLKNFYLTYYIMGNSQSNTMDEEYAKYIKEQQEIINSQQAQINQLYQDRQTQGQVHAQEHGPAKNERVQIKNTPSPTKSKFDIILEIFGLNKDYDEVSLKKAYIKLALEHHPDKGGNPESFQKLQVAYKILLKKLSEKDNDKDHQRLKDENKDYLSQQTSDNRINTNLSKKFDNNLFNKLYEENRQETIYDTGYSKWIQENKVDESKGQKNLFKNGFNENKFNDAFSKEKQKQNQNSSIVEYTEPKVDISYRGKDSIVLLGQEKINNFSGESSSGLSYRDYKDAYTNSCLIDINSVDISKRTGNMRERTRERKNISYTMSEEDMKKQGLLELKEKKMEEQRIKRLNKIDQQAFNTYDAIHKRMLGR